MIVLPIFLAQALVAGAPVFDQAPLPDAVLADLRGGIRLPNGIDAALTIETQTAVNGALVLMTVVKIDTGPPELAVYAPPAGGEVPAQTTSGAATPASSALPTISFDGRNGLHIVPGSGQSPLTVSSGSPSASIGVIPDGLEQVDTASPVLTDNGQITFSNNGVTRTVELASSDLRILHLTGNAFGSAIANSGSDRAIDTQTTLAIDLTNAGPDVIGSTMLRVDNVAIDALASRF